MVSTRFIDVAIKNLKSTFRDRKGLLFLILVPVFFYSLVGLLFGGALGTETRSYVYTVGFVDLDPTTASNPERPAFNVTFIGDVMDDIDSLRVIRFNDEDVARDALASKEVDVLAVFRDGFELALNRSAYPSHAVFDNDTSTHHPSNYTHSVDHFITVASTFTSMTNVTGTPFDTVLASFNASVHDYLVVFQEGFEANLDAGIPGEVLLLHRDGIPSTTIQARAAIVHGLVASIVAGNDQAAITVTTGVIAGTSPPPPPTVNLYYRDSTDPVTRQVIAGTLLGTLDGIVNYNPANAPLDITQGSISGEIKNDITLGGPGYLMYGMLMVLSMGAILLTEEKKSGTLKRLESSTMKPWDMLGGHVTANTVVLCMQFGIGVGVMSLFGFTASAHDAFSVVAGVGITLGLTSLFLNALALLSAVIFKTPEAAGGGVWLFLIPLMSLSGAFFPLEIVAPGLVPYVQWVPTRITVVMLQDMLVNATSLLSAGFWINAAVLGIMGLALFTVGVKVYGKFSRS